VARQFGEKFNRDPGIFTRVGERSQSYTGRRKQLSFGTNLWAEIGSKEKGLFQLNKVQDGFRDGRPLSEL
jgi:hypothetical protein